MVKKNRIIITRSRRRNDKEVVVKGILTPKVSTLEDLINLGRNDCIYSNINNRMLKRITPYLIELNNMIGMKDLKKTIFYQIIYYIKGLHSKNRNEEYLHTIIMGPPGSGKTTVAKILAGIYKSMGVLSKDAIFKVAYRDDFIGAYLGQTAIKSRKLLNSCIGGVLFVDELYSLGNSDGKSNDMYSKEAIDTITGFLSDHKNDFCFIGAGYEDDIKKCFLDKNKGLRRRFQWMHVIKEYDTDELVDIAYLMISKIKWDCKIDKNKFSEILKKEANVKNGGDLEQLISKMKMFHSKRVFTMPNKHMFVFTMEDLIGGLELFREHNPTRVKKVDKPPYGMYL